MWASLPRGSHVSGLKEEAGFSVEWASGRKQAKVTKATESVFQAEGQKGGDHRHEMRRLCGAPCVGLRAGRCPGAGCEDLCPLALALICRGPFLLHRVRAGRAPRAQGHRAQAMLLQTLGAGGRRKLRSQSWGPLGGAGGRSGCPEHSAATPCQPLRHPGMRRGNHTTGSGMWHCSKG